MVKTIAERLMGLAEILSQKAGEIRMKTQGVEVNGNSRNDKEVGK
ncbi:hypothetical protein Q8A72_11645 [Aeribacillus pallidus]|nr:hypothetical protein [Aeribacillus pallidus]